MNELYKKIATNISQVTGNPNDKEIWLYSLELVGQSVIVFGLIFLISTYLDILNLSFVVILSNIILRSISGGNHLNKSLYCSVLSIIMICLFAFLSKTINISQQLLFIIGLVIVVSGLYVIYKYVPVDNPNKPITNPILIRRYRFLSFIYMILLLFVTFSTNFTIVIRNILLGIYFGVGWQLFTLIPLSKMVFNKINLLGDKITSRG